MISVTALKSVTCVSPVAPVVLSLLQRRLPCMSLVILTSVSAAFHVTPLCVNGDIVNKKPHPSHHRIAYIAQSSVEGLRAVFSKRCDAIITDQLNDSGDFTK